MQPDFGFTTSSPKGQFYFPRSYVRQLRFTAGGWPATWADNVFTLFVGSPLVYTEVVIFRTNFVTWSSNCYSLDYIVEQIYYFVPGQWPPSPAGAGVNWFPTSDTGLIAIQIDLVATSLPYFTVELPPAPDDYWIPQKP
jgi:hypothetical protein